MLRRALASLTALAVAGLVAGASPAGADVETFTVTMTGAQEAPNPGDPDGTGIARITVDTDTNRICFVLTVSNIVPATAAHIHVAPPGVAGPVVVPLPAPTNGRSAGCVIDTDADAIAANPAFYYVNVHNNPFPGGAVRAQLA
jgi:hypothetical protein